MDQKRQRLHDKYRAHRHSGNYFVPIYQKVRKGIVFIRALINEEESDPLPPYPYYFPTETRRNELVLGIGTGFIIRKNGLIVTSEHVVSNPQKIFVKLYNGKQYTGKVVWSDKDHDIALIKIESSAPLLPVTLGSSRRSEVGEIVLSVGNPMGLESSITSGIISRKHASVSISDTELNDIIQTDCAINPGSSGGPLINLRGHVIGMNAFMAKNKNGLGFALGIDGIKKRISQYLR